MGKVCGAVALYQRPSCPGVPLMAAVAVGLVYGSTVFKNNFEYPVFRCSSSPSSALHLLHAVHPRRDNPTLIVRQFHYNRICICHSLLVFTHSCSPFCNVIPPGSGPRAGAGQHNLSNCKLYCKLNDTQN